MLFFLFYEHRKHYKLSIKDLQNYTFYSKYARYQQDHKRRETWNETIDRVFDMHRTFYKDKLDNNPDLQEHFDFAEKMLRQKKVLGSQRALQFGGEAILKKNERLYNCTVSYADRSRFFQECLYVLLCGCGAGISVQRHHTDKLPYVYNRNKGKKTHVAEDSIEGWANCLGVLMSSYFATDQTFPEYNGYEVEFDLSNIRPAGSEISWGGIAPGPEGLKNSLNKIKDVIDAHLTENGDQTRLPPIDVYDIIMHMSDAVLSGGIRRSAVIIIFDKDDQAMATAKTGDWFIANPQRGRSNNSAMLVRDETTKQEFAALFESVKNFGEPGFVWAEHRDVVFNPCCEIGMWPQLEDGTSGWEFCNLSEINMGKVHSEQDFYDACRAASILGTIQAGYTKFDYLGSTTEQIVRKEALLGVSMTGMMDSPEIAFDKKIQKNGAKAVLAINEQVAGMLDINICARSTCIKPSGTASCILGTASGIHPQHAKRYFRRVQANKMEFPVQHFKSINPKAVEHSVWSANNTDDVVTFLCEVPDGSKTKNCLGAIELLEMVHLTQNNWVEYGSRPENSTRDFLRHNVSNTITVKPEEWDDVEKFIFKNRDSFAGISLLPFSGDKDYDQAPFTAVYTPTELVRMYGDSSVFASGLIVDCEHCFDTLFKGCDTVLGIGEQLDDPDAKDDIDHYDLKVDWVRRAKQFAERYFDGDIRQMTYCLKDVSNWKLWCDLKREYEEVDWNSVVEEKETKIKADSIGSAECSGGTCEWTGG